MKAADAIMSVLQSSCNSQEKARVPCACGDKKNAGTLEAELHKKEWTPETIVPSPRLNKPSNHSIKKRRKKKNLVTTLFLWSNLLIVLRKNQNYPLFWVIKQ